MTREQQDNEEAKIKAGKFDVKKHPNSNKSRICATDGKEKS
jgi:hypothetical protein